MADNKFLTRLKGKQIAKSSVQIDNDKLSPVFGDMPVGSDGLENIIQQSNSSTVVAKGAQNWYLSGDSMVLSDNDQYVSEFKVSGQGLWVNSSYELTSNMVIAPHSKWVLRFCGDNLLNSAGHKVSISVLIKTGTTTLASKSFMLEEQANFFCKVLEFDFDNTYESICKILSGASLTVQVLCGDEGASATIYNGKTTLTLLQRMVDADTVAFNGTSLVDIMAGYIPEDYFKRYQEQVEDGAEAQAVFTRDGDTIDLSGWEDKASDQIAEHNTSEEAHADIRTELAGKQAQLTAGQNITIDENNVISATGEISVEFAALDGDPYDNDNLAEALNEKADDSDLQTHIEDKTNPHEVTKAQVGLGNVDNTADLDKPISTATQAALNTKQDELTAGDNIDITNNVISATDTTYTAGNGLTLTGTQFSANVINNTTSSSTTDALSAAAGKSLQDQVNNLLGRGKYLSIWDCTTGLAMDEPPVNPYTVETGSYFIVGKVASAGGTNYRPNGGVYDKDVPSTTVETETIKVNDTYYYDGTTWRLLDTPVVDVAFSTLAGSPYDNTNLANALNSKQNITDNTLATTAKTIVGAINELEARPAEPAIDEISITKNSDQELQTVGVIDDNDNSTAIKTWTGTLAEYQAIVTKDTDTMYTITDDVTGGTSVYTKAQVDSLLATQMASVNTLFATLYPVGSIYIGTQATCPLSTIIAGSTWELVSSGRSLQGADSSHSAGSTIEAGLPNITGSVSSVKQLNANYNLASTSGAFSSLGQSGAPGSIRGSADATTYIALVGFDASHSSSIYGNSTTVQPNAYVVNIWKRTA